MCVCVCVCVCVCFVCVMPFVGVHELSMHMQVCHVSVQIKVLCVSMYNVSCLHVCYCVCEFLCLGAYVRL